MGGDYPGRPPSATTIASSVSGSGTPEIPDPILPYAPSPRQFARGYSYDEARQHAQFSPSNYSAFTRLPALEDDEDVPGNILGLPRRRALFGAPSTDRAAGIGYTPARLSPVEALWERQRSLAERDTLAETDEETAQEDEMSERFRFMRGSLPMPHPLPRLHASGPGDRWDFKTRALPFSNLPVVRVSPLMSDHEQGDGGGRVVKKVPVQSAQSENITLNRASTGTPPDKATSAIVSDSTSQSPQNAEEVLQSSDSGDKEERGEGEEVGSEEGEESEGEATALQRRRDIVAEHVENGAKAVHVDRTRHPSPPSLPLQPLTTLPMFHRPSLSSSLAKPSTTSSSTPNSLTRPRHTVATHTAKQRTPSVPSLPTSLLATSVDPSGLSGLPECLGDYERTLNNARNYMREFKALAESGSSDQESDPEPTNLATRLNAVEIMEHISSAAQLPTLINHHLVTLHKEGRETDLGFSLSDGFGEPGVYVKSIHSGGLAESNGQLRHFDRIMKVGN